MQQKDKPENLQIGQIRNDFGIDDGRWQWDVQLNTVRATRKAFDVFGLEYQNEGYNMQHLLQAIHEEDRPEVEAEITAMTLNKLRDTIIQYRVVRPDGSVRIARTYGKAVTNTENALTHLVGMTEDITDDPGYSR